jgi:hypothetical protein
MVLGVYGDALHNFYLDLDETVPELNVLFVDFAPIWEGVVGRIPGSQAFGFASTDIYMDVSKCWGPPWIEPC